MIDTGDLFMVQSFRSGDWELEIKHIAIVVEPDDKGIGWICQICSTGAKFTARVKDIEEGKILLAQQTTYR